MSSAAELYLAAGLLRSGSTWLFNALRLLLGIQHRDVHATWIEDYNFENLSKSGILLIKLHKKCDELASRASRIFTTHRDLRDIAVSARDMGWGNDDEAMLNVALSARQCHEYWQPRSALDVGYADIVQRPARVVLDLSRVLEVTISYAEANILAKELTLLKNGPNSAQLYDPRTLLHRRHVFDGRPNRFQEQMSLKLNSEIVRCNREWLTRMGYDVSL